MCLLHHHNSLLLLTDNDTRKALAHMIPSVTCKQGRLLFSDSLSRKSDRSRVSTELVKGPPDSCNISEDGTSIERNVRRDTTAPLSIRPDHRAALRTLEVGSVWAPRVRQEDGVGGIGSRETGAVGQSEDTDREQIEARYAFCGSTDIGRNIQQSGNGFQNASSSTATHGPRRLARLSKTGPGLGLGLWSEVELNDGLIYKEADRWERSRVRQFSTQDRQENKSRSWGSGNEGGVKLDHSYGTTSIWKMGDPEGSLSSSRKEKSRRAEDVVKELHAALDRALNDRRVKDAVMMVQDLAAVKRVPNQKSFLRLISLLCRDGGFVTAKHLLKLFPDRSEVRLDEFAHGTLVNCALRTGHLEDAEELLQAMMEDGYQPRVATWSSVVARLGRNAQTAGRALAVFNQMCDSERPQASRPDAGACNAAINAAVTAGDLQVAEELLEMRMPELGVAADVIAYNILVKGYAQHGDRQKMCGVMEKMQAAGVMPDEATYNTLVSAYVGMGDVLAGEAMVREMQKLGARCKPAVRTLTTLINGFVEQQEVHKARMLLDSMQSDYGFPPNEVAYTSVIGAYANSGQLEAAQKLLVEMAELRIPANVVTYNTLISGYCRAGQWEHATCLFKDMQEAGVAADVITYNTLIHRCIRREDNVAALDWFKQMRKGGLGASTQSYTNLIKLFGDNGQPWLAARVFEEMESDSEVHVDRAAWNSLINSFSRGGLMAEAEAAFRSMKAAGVIPNLPTYGTLVRGYSRLNLAPQCLVLWREIKERLQAGQVALQVEAQRPARWKKERGEEPFEADEALLDDLVYVCVRAGYFQRALEIVRCMEDGGISADRLKYKRLFIELYSDLKGNDSPLNSATRASPKSNKSVEAFKFWLGLPNHYYRGEWDWRDKPPNPRKQD